MMDDCLIIGGGVIGLSIAYELSSHGLRVRVIDRQQPGAEASWAGAGILPPASRRPQSPIEQLAELSARLHTEWAERLRDETGIDTEYRRCGGWLLFVSGLSSMSAASDVGNHIRASVRPMDAADDVWSSLPYDPVTFGELEAGEPAFGEARRRGAILSAAYSGEEAQLRNPGHLKALVAACRQRGVTIETGVEVSGFWSSARHVVGAQTSAGPRYAGSFCITAGAWSGRLAQALGLQMPVKPIRGQMVLLQNPQPALRHIVNVGQRYLVPRLDGRVLVGSTEEDAGFEKRNTEEGVAGLLDFARTLIPAWKSAVVERTWAGLRPATVDGVPYLGGVPELDNLFVAAGHFRSGIYLSPATATVMSAIVRGLPAPFDLSAFRIDRDVLGSNLQGSQD
jgi:glycine oxidase